MVDIWSIKCCVVDIWSIFGGFFGGQYSIKPQWPACRRKDLLKLKRAFAPLPPWQNFRWASGLAQFFSKPNRRVRPHGASVCYKMACLMDALLGCGETWDHRHCSCCTRSNSSKPEFRVEDLGSFGDLFEFVSFFRIPFLLEIKSHYRKWKMTKMLPVVIEKLEAPNINLLQWEGCFDNLPNCWP